MFFKWLVFSDSPSYKDHSAFVIKTIQYILFFHLKSLTNRIDSQNTRKTRLNFASKTGHLDWYSNNLDLYEISKIKIYSFFILATNAIRSATFQFLLVINSNHGAISHRYSDFRQMTLIWRFKVIKGQTDYAIGFATYHFLYVFYSNYSAISHGNPVFQQMTLIWPFKVSKGQTYNAIRFTTNDLLSVFYSNYSAISHGKPVFQYMTLIWPFKVTEGQTD